MAGDGIMNEEIEKYIKKFKDDKRASAELRLALLKENFQFKGFYEKLKADPYSICPELRKPEESYEEYSSRTHLMQVKGKPFFGGYAEVFGVNDKFFLVVQEVAIIPTEEFLILLDPNKEINTVSSSELVQMLPLLFFSSGLSTPFQSTAVKSELQPYEKLITIDLRKRKTQLIEELTDFIDEQLNIHNAGVRLNLDSAIIWKPPENNRERKEAWGQLEVWKLRKQRKNFRWISRELRISEDLAKKRFYRAYELVQRESYDPDRYRKEGWKVRKSDLLRICDNCKDQRCLEQMETGGEWTPCPEVLNYINQDYVPRKEKLLKKILTLIGIAFFIL